MASHYSGYGYGYSPYFLQQDSQPMGTYQYTGDPYQLASSFHNTGSYSCPYYSPVVYGGYPRNSPSPMDFQRSMDDFIQTSQKSTNDLIVIDKQIQAPTLSIKSTFQEIRELLADLAQHFRDALKEQSQEELVQDLEDNDDEGLEMNLDPPTQAPIAVPTKTQVNRDSAFQFLEPAENGADKSMESHAIITEGSNLSTVADSVTEVVDEGKEPLTDEVFKHLLNAISFSDSRICLNFILPSSKPVCSSYCEYATFASSTFTPLPGKMTVCTIAATPPQPPHYVLVFDPGDINVGKEKQNPVFYDAFHTRQPPPEAA